MSVVTNHWHFCAGEGGSQANSMLLQPYRKSAWPSCQPAIYGPWEQKEGEEGRERKHSPPPTPAKKSILSYF